MVGLVATNSISVFSCLWYAVNGKNVADVPAVNQLIQLNRLILHRVSVVLIEKSHGNTQFVPSATAVYVNPLITTFWPATKIAEVVNVWVYLKLAVLVCARLQIYDLPPCKHLSHTAYTVLAAQAVYVGIAYNAENKSIFSISLYQVGRVYLF